MKVHSNAKTTLKSRLFIVSQVGSGVRSVAEAAEAAGVSERTVYKWLARYRAQGRDGLLDRSSRPARIPISTDRRRVETICALRKIRMSGPEIAEVLAMPLSTVSVILRRAGLGKLSSLEPRGTERRYEKQLPGELLHIDVKKLARFDQPGHRVRGGHRVRSKGAGYEYVHVCVDDATRVSYVEVLRDEKATTAIGFLRRTVQFYRSYGVVVKRLMTDNGSAYRSIRHAAACKTLGIKHITTKPYRPQTNGKAERFIRTLSNGWAYGAIYRNSSERTAALAGWLHHYNHRRPHSSLSRQPPMTRLNNVLGSYT